MSILDLQGLAAADDGHAQGISSYLSTGGCCVPSPIHSGWSIGCYDSYAEQPAY
ncbi:hypothetical protein ACWCPI_38185 [Streptomyces sp. NPDC001920]